MRNILKKSWLFHFTILLLLTVISHISRADDDKGGDGSGTLEILVNNGAEQIIPARIYLTDAAGAVFAPENRNLWESAFISPGKDSVSLPPGNYQITAEKGPEWNTSSDQVRINPGETTRQKIVLNRLANMNRDGWYSGDLHVHRPIHEMEQIMRAEDLDLASLQTWWNESNTWKSTPSDSRPRNPVLEIHDGDKRRFLHVMSGEDERSGGAILYHRLSKPLEITGSTPEYPPSTAWFNQATHLGAWLEIEKPFWWDTPAWLATGQIRSIGIAQNHIQRNGMLDNEAWGRPRNMKKFPGPHGNGLYTQELYYRILNCGFRIPPSAGSASGVLPNPVGYNRVYVFCGTGFTWDAWWDGLQAGKAFVTNGPLLNVTADNHLPGHDFSYSSNRLFPPSIILDGQIRSRDAIDRIELVFNGRISSVELPFNFQPESSGWFLIRVITKVENTFRFASSAPWYVDFMDRPFRPDPDDVTFFLNWTNQRMESVRKSDLPKTQMNQALEPHLKSREFWSKLVE